MSIKKLPLFKRPRQKLLHNGPETLSDIELVAILIGSGRKGKSALDVARSLMPSGHIKDLVKYDKERLLKSRGIGPARTSVLVASLELGKRIYQEEHIETIQKTRDAVHLLSSIVKKKREHFVALYLNARYQLIEKKVISIGSLDASIVHPREVYEPAIRLHAAMIIVGHNHPSGDSQPSHADILLTKRLFEAGKILGVDLLDHIILAKKGTTSMKEMHFML